MAADPNHRVSSLMVPLAGGGTARLHRLYFHVLIERFPWLREMYPYFP
jgi:hypothetical protein